MNQQTLSPTYQPCAECGAALDDEQRYCVVCGTSRRHVTDPLARYLAANRRRTLAAAAAPPAAPRRADGRWVAVALALVPLAAGIGALVGRGGASEDSAVLAALRAQKAPVVQIGAASPAGSATTANTTGTGGHTSRSRAHPARASARPPTTQQKAAGAKLVREIQARKGKSYVQQQRNLPDTIVVP
jgi:hypothetical protein